MRVYLLHIYKRFNQQLKRVSYSKFVFLSAKFPKQKSSTKNQVTNISTKHPQIHNNLLFIE